MRDNASGMTPKTDDNEPLPVNRQCWSTKAPAGLPGRAITGLRELKNYPLPARERLPNAIKEGGKVIN